MNSWGIGNWLFVGWSWEHGVATLRVRSVALQVKAPWNGPLFSERHRCQCSVLPLGGGWRFIAAHRP